MIYEAQCPKCGKTHEYSRPVTERNDTPICCGKKTVKAILTPPMTGAMSWGREKAFTATDGTFIDSGHQYKKWMKDNNKIPLEEGKQEAARVRKRRAEEYDKKFTQAAVESYNELKHP